MSQLWQDPKPVLIPPALAETLDEHPIVLETLVRRGITKPEAARSFLDPDHYTPSPPEDLPGMEAAIERLERAIRTRQHVLVWGDFDVDGQTATSLLVSALDQLGGKVSFHIPERSEGHGVHRDKIETFLNQGVQMILTCDTGIAAHDAVAYAQGRGADVIITDHHQLPETLPDACAVVNPQMLPKGHALRTLPGVGVAYKLVEALFTRAGRSTELDQFLDLVALGIVSDVAEQKGETRYLLQRGIRRLRENPRLGLAKIMETANIKQAEADEGTIGFTIGPRLNALSRVGEAMHIPVEQAVELLTTTDEERAYILAQQLEGLNAERKNISDQVYKAAVAMVENDRNLLKYAALVLGHEAWPGGVIGIVANRLVERYQRPVVLFNTQDPELARGSARSVAGCDITAAIAEVAKEKDWIASFGGHTMAAGLSLRNVPIAELRFPLSRSVEKMLGKVETEALLHIDAYVPLATLTEAFVGSLEKLKPFGPGNPALTLASRKLLLLNQRDIGRSGEHLRLSVEDESGHIQEVVWWRAEADRIPAGRFDLAFTVGMNTYKDKSEVQITLVDLRPVDEEPAQFAHREHVEIEDWRGAAKDEQLQRLQNLGADAMIWAEGSQGTIEGTSGDKLTRARTLAIWTIPADMDSLNAALEVVNPDTVLIFDNKPGTDAVNAFIQRFGAVIKHVLNQRDGQTTLSELGAALGHRRATIYAGLEWMAARGHVRISEDDGENLLLAPDGQATREQFAETTTRLASLLQETSAFRAHFQKAAAESLITKGRPKPVK